jgi:glycogen operon protein
MLCAGDELGRTQRGNNNAYCQDNEISWFDWEQVDRDLLTFTRKLIQFVRRHPVFMRRGWFQGRALSKQDPNSLHDIGWLTVDGDEMATDDWANATANVLGVFLNGQGIATPDDRGRRVVDDSFYVMFNAGHEPANFKFPPERWGKAWTLVLDTQRGFLPENETVERKAGQAWELVPRSLAVWKR